MRSLEVRLHDVDLALLGRDDVAGERLDLVVVGPLRGQLVKRFGPTCHAGGRGFEYGGWLVPYADEDMGRLETESFAAADAFLLGRRTYEILAAYWPHHDAGDSFPDSGPMAEKLNRLPKYVVSTTLNEVTWNNSTLIAGDVADEVAKLKRQPGKELQVHGSGDLVQTLMRYDLVDEYRLWICPLVVGRGKRLFGDDSAPTALKLVDTNTTGTGAVLHVYHPAGKPTPGSFAPEQ